MITETNYPLLAWTGYPLGDVPDTIPIATLDQRGHDFLAGSKAFAGFITLFHSDRYVGTTLKEKVLAKEARPANFYPARNLYLTPLVAQKLDHDQAFRDNLWRSIRNLPTVSGTILWKIEQAGVTAYAQYTYRVLSLTDSDTFFRMGNVPPQDVVPDARLVLVGAFVEDTLSAFEYGYLGQSGELQVCSTSSYYSAPDAEVGQYLSYTTLTLMAWLKNLFPSRELRAGEGINQTRQPITVLSHR